MTSSDDSNRPPNMGFADDDEAAGRYVPVFADDDEPAASTPDPAVSEPVFADDDEPAAVQPSDHAIPEQPEAAVVPEPVFDHEDESADPETVPAASEVTADGDAAEDDEPEHSPTQQVPSEDEPLLPENHTPQTDASSDEQQRVDTVEPAEGILPNGQDRAMVGDINESPDKSLVDTPEADSQRDSGADAPKDRELNEQGVVEDEHDDADLLGLDDSFFSMTSAPVSPAPHGLPTLKGVSATQIGSAEEWVGDDAAVTAPTTSGILWAADDIAVAGPPVESPDFTTEPASDGYDVVADESLDPSDGYYDGPYAEQAAATEPDYAETPSEPVQGGYIAYSDDPDDGYTEPAAVDSVGDYDPEPLDDYAEYEDEYADEYVSEEVYDDSQAALDPDDLVAEEPVSKLRERSRSKTKGRTRRDKADAKLAKESAEPGDKPSLVNGKNVGIAAVVLIGGFLAVRAFSGGTDDSSTTDQADQQRPPASSQVESAPVSPAPTKQNSDCMTASETVGTAVVCSAPGDQRTGTNAILAYEKAFYGDRDADRVYALTRKASEGGPEAEAAKQRLQKDINGTPCGSTYSVSVTPKEIGKLYDVTITVTSPQGDPMPGPDGVCPADVQVSDSPDGIERPLIQEVAVEGGPGSFVISSVKPK